MHYIDTNILIYVNDVDSPFHKSACEIFYDLLEQDRVIFHEIVLAEFYSIITDSRKMQFPWSPLDAGEYIHDLLASSANVHFLDSRILTDALNHIDTHNITRYKIYDHLIAYSMRAFAVEKIVTLNKKDFQQYSFIKEIISPSR